MSHDGDLSNPYSLLAATKPQNTDLQEKISPTTESAHIPMIPKINVILGKKYFLSQNR